MFVTSFSSTATPTASLVLSAPSGEHSDTGALLKTIPAPGFDSPIRHRTSFDAVLMSPSASGWSVSIYKRIIDIVVSVSVLIVFALPMLCIALCIRLSSNGPAIFIQKRTGRKGTYFSIYKFRTMSEGSETGLTRAGDVHIHSLGRWLRRFKLDELPQFFDILIGDMSLVGPRPKLSQYAGILDMPYRPGLTGAATLAFRREEDILQGVGPYNVEAFYHQRIKPIKARIDVRYMRRATFSSDVLIILETFLSCIAFTQYRSALRGSFPLARVAGRPSIELELQPMESCQAAD